MGSRHKLLPRWNLGNINVILKSLEELIPNISKPRGPGRPPKHNLKKYICLLVLKELKCASLRNAEIEYSKVVCNERVDHSVIHYWEKNIDKELIKRLVRTIGAKLEDLLGYELSVIDATSFSNWHKNTKEFHVLVRIHNKRIR